MKTSFKILLLCLSILWLNSSCSKDDSSNSSFVNDFTIEMDENPTENQFIGTVPYNGGKYGYYHLVTSILTQSVPNAVYVFSSGNFGSNAIQVNDPILFDFETNPIIKVTLKVEEVGGNFFDYKIFSTKTIVATIKLNNLSD